MQISEQFFGFTPPILRKNNSLGEFIEYNVYNPTTMRMERQRIRLERLSTHFATRAQYRVHVNNMICQLNSKLASGWSPFGAIQNVKEFTPLKDALEAYIVDRSRELREASMVSYTSVNKMLISWLTANNLDNMASHLFNVRLAVRYMDELLTHPKFNNNTYNTYLKKYRACFSWMCDHGYCKENPFDKVKTRQKQEKIRGLIPADAREKVLNYVRQSDEPNYEIVMHLVFSSLIRPSEIERIQVGDVDIKNACIHIPPEKAKTHKERFAPLTDSLIGLLIPLLAKGCPSDWYLLGKELVPAKEKCWHGKFKKDWMKIRKALDLPSDMQLYSLKDSGITELLESGLDPLTVMKAADHHDLATTTKYASHRDKNMINKVRLANVGIERSKQETVEIIS